VGGTDGLAEGEGRCWRRLEVCRTRNRCSQRRRHMDRLSAGGAVHTTTGPRDKYCRSPRKRGWPVMSNVHASVCTCFWHMKNVICSRSLQDLFPSSTAYLLLSLRYGSVVTLLQCQNGRHMSMTSWCVWIQTSCDVISWSEWVETITLATPSCLYRVCTLTT